VLASAALVLLLRTFGFEYVFVDGDVVFPPADPQYHLRRGVQVFESFPSVLLFDHYINYPGGAPIPWPPLFDIVIGLVPRAFGMDEHGFEVFAAWLSPLCALIACVPIVLVARRVSGESGPRVPALSLLIFATVPLLVNLSRIGMADHHAAVSMAGAWLLLCCVVHVDPVLEGRSARRWLIALVIARLAVMLTWHGSLLYLGVAEAGLALHFVATGRHAVARRQAIGAAVTAAVLLPILAVMPTPLGGNWSAIALSNLHVAAMLGVAGVLAATSLASRRLALDTPLGRLAIMVGASIVFVCALLALPGPRGGLMLAWEFMSMSDGVGAVTGEQLPLFDLGGRSAVKPFKVVWSWWALLIPFVPMGVWLSARRHSSGSGARSGAWILIIWSAVFGVLAIVQRRYGNDYGPSAAVGLAIGFVWAVELLAARFALGRLRPHAATAMAVGLVVATAWPALALFHVPRAQSSWLAVRGHARVGHGAHATIAWTLKGFLHDVRARTPETSGYYGGESEPEYGVIAHPNLGHAIQYEARRATATDPFWAYIGRENWARTHAFMASRDEDEALGLAEALHGRFVITMPGLPNGSVMKRLHVRDGAAVGRLPALSRFRLVGEAPGGAPALGRLFDPRGSSLDPPYKLFEIVSGAVLEFDCASGEQASATVKVMSPARRTFEWHTTARAGVQGRVHLRVPWSTERPAAGAQTVTVTLGPVRVACADEGWSVEVSERAVLEGLVVDADPPAGSSARR